MKRREQDRRAQKDRARRGLTMLDCYFCGKNLPGFTELAAHVKREHADTAMRSASVDESRERVESRPMPREKAAAADRREFLRPADLNRRGSTDIRFEKHIRTFTSKFGPQLVIDVKVNGKPFAFGVKLNGQNHIALEKKLGRNLIEWAGKTITATVKTFDSDDGQREYIELAGASRRDRD